MPASVHEDPFQTHPGADEHSSWVSSGVQSWFWVAVVVPAGVPVVPVVVVVEGIVGRVVGTQSVPVHMQPLMAWHVGEVVPPVQIAGVEPVVVVVGVVPEVVVDVPDVELLGSVQEAGGLGTLQFTVAAPLPGLRAGAPPPELWDLHDVMIERPAKIPTMIFS